MRTDDDAEQDAGRDPLDPEELAAPHEPPPPERPHETPPIGPLTGPLRLRENSVRRVRPRGGAVPDEPSADADTAQTSDRTSSLGDMLSEERRRQGKTLTDVAMATRVRARLLEALERGDYDALPSPAYVKGYIQSYAEFLEVPAGPLIARFNTEIGTREAIPDQHPYIRAPVSLGTTAPRKRLGGDRIGRGMGGGGGRGTSLHLPNGRVWLLVAALVVVVVTAIGIAGLLAKSRQDLPPLPPETPQTNTTSGAPGAVGTATPQPPGSAPTSSAVTPAPPKPSAESTKAPPGQFAVTIRVKPGKVSYVSVTVDGRQGYTGTRTSGRPLTYYASSLVVVKVGRPSAVEITRDGAPVNVPDSTGTFSTVQVAAP